MGERELRETFATRTGALLSLIGVAVGLGNVWRFPYMVGRFGGAGFVLVYTVAVLALGIPALMAENALGRRTRRGPVGAFARVGLPGGRQVGWFLFFVICAANAYYCNAVGWVLYETVRSVAALVGVSYSAGAALPPASGFDGGTFGRQLLFTAIVIVSCGFVLLRGLRRGIERASRWIMPVLGIVVLLLVVRTLTLPGAGDGVRWYLLRLGPESFRGSVLVAAIGQAFFSLALGGTFMVVYGSYLDRSARLAPLAGATAFGDLGAGLLAGLAIVPAVLALGLEPDGGPAMLFSTMPEVFARMPAGNVVALLFFGGLFAAAYLSAVAAFEVLVAGLVDNTRLERRRAVPLAGGIVFLLALPPMINLEIFVRWDLTFGSGMQTLGGLLAVLAFGWCLSRNEAMKEIGPGLPNWAAVWLYRWLRYAVPGVIVVVAAWWLWTEVL